PPHRLVGEPRGDVHRVAENVAVLLHHWPGVKADAQSELVASHGRKRLDGSVHPRRRACRGIRRRKQHHYLVAHRLHHPPAVRFRGLAQLIDARADGLERRGVANRVVELRAPAYISEKNRCMSGGLHRCGRYSRSGSAANAIRVTVWAPAVLRSAAHRLAGFHFSSLSRIGSSVLGSSRFETKAAAPDSIAARRNASESVTDMTTTGQSGWRL